MSNFINLFLVIFFQSGTSEFGQTAKNIVKQNYSNES